MSSYDDAAVSIWPQSGEANLSQLHLSLLTDNDNDYHADNDTETSIECPPSLYWCRDTCYSPNICQKIANDDGQLYQQIYGTDFNLISSMFEQTFMNQVWSVVSWTNIHSKLSLLLGGCESQNQCSPHGKVKWDHPYWSHNRKYRWKS